ncbi:putative transposase [Klebsiella pneumoniae subsp. pneumoniae Kp13]|nr:putative transposase [Klebsiella pneumoniae subsp. pneumoniae Kp13]
MTSSSARKWTNSGDTSGLNRASAGCFTRMTGSGRRLLRTYSVNALWRRWGVL